MKLYELTLVLSPDLTSEKQKALLEKVKSIIEAAEGKVKKTIDWGKKEIAYQIKGKAHGFYWHLQVELDEKSPASLSKKMKLEEGILRFLLCVGSAGQVVDEKTKIKK